MTNSDELKPARGGRIVLDESGKEIARYHIDPERSGDPDPAAIKNAHSYKRAIEAGQKFKALSPEEREKLRVKPAADAPSPDVKPAVKKESK